MTQVVLIDGTGLLVRCIKACGSSRMRAGDIPTGPAFLFLKSLARRLSQLNPTHVAVAWDGEQARSWRHQVYAGYKSGRPPFSHDQHYHLACEACYAAGVFQYVVADAEADDLIAAFHRTARKLMPDAEIVLLSDDQDLLQLLDERTVQLGLTDDGISWDLDKVRQEFNCDPVQIPLVKALAGDRSDNIPGHHGFGLKTAVRALAAHDWKLTALPFTDEDMAKVLRFWTVMNLKFAAPGWLEEHFALPFEQSLRWDPDEAEPRLRGFLQRYEMASLLQRLGERRLWHQGT